MKTVKFKGQYPVCFHNIGELKPDDTAWVPDELAKNLVARGEFEIVVSRTTPAKSSKLETDKSASRGNK